MKRMITSLLVVVLMFGTIGIAAFSAVYEQDFFEDLRWGYQRFLPTLSNRPITARYQPYTESGSTTYAWTKLSVSTDATGRVSTQINGDMGDIQVGSTTQPSGGYITHKEESSSTYATKVNHYANRRIGENETADMWNYWVYHEVE